MSDDHLVRSKGNNENPIHKMAYIRFYHSTEHTVDSKQLLNEQKWCSLYQDEATLPRVGPHFLIFH